MRRCEYREALEDGRVICQKVAEGNPEVDPSICRRCPVMAINCQHLRFTLRKLGHKPILVRFGNGRTEVWDDDPPAVEFIHGACAEKVMPISGARDCVGCRVRCPVRREPAPESRPAIREPVVARGSNVIMFPTAGLQRAQVDGSSYDRSASATAGRPTSATADRPAWPLADRPASATAGGPAERSVASS